MTIFEFAYSALEWTVAVHYVKVRRILKKLCKGTQGFQLLDVGGRKSYYTINLNCDVHIVDLPRKSKVQKQLRLGFTPDMLEQIRKRRSNIKSVRLEDITNTTFKDNTFDGVVAVEVIEHVQDDSAFVYQIHRILKQGGSAVLTTPNGETKENTNPDHVRHYTRDQFKAKLREHFDDVDVFYGVRQGFLHDMAVKGWASRKPSRILVAPLIMFCTLLANLLECGSSTKSKSTNHLFAVAIKAQKITREVSV